MGGIHDDPDIGVDVARNECATETLNSKYFIFIPELVFLQYNLLFKQYEEYRN